MQTLVNGNIRIEERHHMSRVRGWTRSPLISLVIVLMAVVWGPAPRATAAGGPWSRVTSLPTPRYGLAAVTGPNRKIYAIGGDESAGADANKISDRVEAYDPSANSWTIEAPIPTLRDGFAAATGSDGKIYAMGGFVSDSFAGHVVDTVEAYNPATNAWSTEARMPIGLSDFAAVTGRNGKIYAIGGAESNSTGGEETLGRVEVYDSTSNSWTTGASMPTPRSGFAAALGSNGKIYTIGGQNSQTTIVSTAEAYDPTTNAWSTEVPLPTARYGLAAATGLNGKIYALGGYTGGATVATAEVYDPAAKYWSRVSPMPTAREFFPAVTGSDGRIYAIGGGIDNGSTILSRVDAYTSSFEKSTLSLPTITFTSLRAFNSAGRAQATYTVGSSVYITGTYTIRHAAASVIVNIFENYSYWYLKKKQWRPGPHPSFFSQHSRNGVSSFSRRYVIAPVPAGVTRMRFTVDLFVLQQLGPGRQITIGVRQPKS
jgi:N-acetylneuraminic acid mutarotase